MGKNLKANYLGLENLDLEGTLGQTNEILDFYYSNFFYMRTHENLDLVNVTSP